MKPILLPIAMLFFCSGIFKTTFSQSTYFQVTVYFKSGVTRNVTATDTSATVTGQDILNVLASYSIPTNFVQPAFPEFNESDTLIINIHNSDTMKIMDKAKVFTITVSDTITLINLVNSLKTLPEVVFAEENGNATSMITPNDLYYHQQWGFKNNTQPGNDIHAEGAWDISTGNPNSIIAIIDDGIDLTHPDLQSKIIAADHTGYSVIPYGGLPGGLSHGTAIASVAAAVSNNITGISGVDWQAKILSEDRTDYNKCLCIGYLTHPHGDVLISKKIVSAINYSDNVWTLNHSYALQYQNNSFGRTSIGLREAFSEAYKKNRVSSVAAGNTGTLIPTIYPAAINSGVIAVGESKMDDNFDGTSTYGPFLGVIAPEYNYCANYNNHYADVAGSSISSPFVAGIASLLKGFNTNLYNDDIIHLIEVSADYKGPTPPYDQQNGFGRANAQKALQLLQSPYLLQHFTIGAGTTYSTSSTGNFIFLGALHYPDSRYGGDKIEVRKTINLPPNVTIKGIWGTGIGSHGSHDDLGTCFGEGFTEVVPGTLNSTQVTLRTYVYLLRDPTTLLQIGYFPCAPSSAVFGYSILSVDQPNITGPTAFCNSGTYTLNNIFPGSTVTWTVAPSGIVNYVQNLNQITLTKLTQGTVTLTATINGSTGSAYSLNITTVPQVSSVTANMSGTCSNGIQTWIVSATPNMPAGATNWHWTIDNATSGITIYNPNSQSTTMDVSRGGGVSVTYTDQCGETSSKNGITIYSQCGHSFAISPNPANSSVAVNLVSSTSAGNQASGISEINIYDNQGNMKKHIKYPRVKSATINTSDLPIGMYVIEIIDGLKNDRQKLQIVN